MEKEIKGMKLLTGWLVKRVRRGAIAIAGGRQGKGGKGNFVPLSNLEICIAMMIMYGDMNEPK